MDSDELRLKKGFLKILQMFSILLLISTLCFVMGCARRESSQLSKTVKQSPLPLLVIIGLDSTSSYGYFDTARTITESVVNNAPQDSVIMVRWITNDSYLPNCSIMTATVPQRQKCSTSNPYDKRCQVLQAIHDKQLDAWRSEIKSKIASAPFPDSGRTDIYGFLVLCAERVKEWRGESYIVIFSDLENNVKKYEPFLSESSLLGARVVVGAFDQKNPKLRVIWTENFKNLGADSIQFISPDESTPEELSDALGFKNIRSAIDTVVTSKK